MELSGAVILFGDMDASCRRQERRPWSGQPEGDARKRPI